jgi:hypothetical protein
MPTQNSAFDQLFAAAADPAMSAIIEAKLASEQAALNIESQQSSSASLAAKRNSISRSRNGSFRQNANGSTTNGGSFRRAGSRTPNESIDSKTGLNGGGEQLLSTSPGALTPTNSKRFSNSLKISDSLGAPTALTRSCSCKRAASFKRMKSKNASPNRSPHQATTPTAPATGYRNGELEAAGDDAFHILSSRGVVPARRGTQCSETMMDDLATSPLGGTDNGRHASRVGSLPFEMLQFLHHQQQQQHHLQQLTPTDAADPAGTYRVRQFNTTSNGSVINRGDSFKRSFKRSTQSIASVNNKKEPSTASSGHTLPSHLAVEGGIGMTGANLLNLPDFNSGYTSKSANNSVYDVNETSFNGGNDEESITVGVVMDQHSHINQNHSGSFLRSVGNSSRIQPTGGARSGGGSVTPTFATMRSQESVRPYIVYMIGSTSVGKNALVKQFNTSEYRGTYQLNQNQALSGNVFYSLNILKLEPGLFLVQFRNGPFLK